MSCRTLVYAYFFGSAFAPSSNISDVLISAVQPTAHLLINTALALISATVSRALGWCLRFKLTKRPDQPCGACKPLLGNSIAFVLDVPGNTIPGLQTICMQILSRALCRRVNQAPSSCCLWYEDIQRIAVSSLAWHGVLVTTCWVQLAGHGNSTKSFRPSPALLLSTGLLVQSMRNHCMMTTVGTVESAETCRPFHSLTPHCTDGMMVLVCNADGDAGANASDGLHCRPPRDYPQHCQQPLGSFVTTHCEDSMAA